MAIMKGKLYVERKGWQQQKRSRHAAGVDDRRVNHAAATQTPHGQHASSAFPALEYIRKF